MRLQGSVMLSFLLRWSGELLVWSYGLLALIFVAIADFLALLPRLVRFACRLLIDAARLIGWLWQRIAACLG